jgi:uncharacterized protein YciI
MAHYAEAMIARGPTMSADGKTVTGSVHIVELPDADAARVFAFEDPLAKGGVFEHIKVYRFRNVLGRTMWQFEGDSGNRRFLFLGEARSDASMAIEMLDAQQAYMRNAENAKRVIAFGPLLGADGVTWQGTAALLETIDIESAGVLTVDDPAYGQYAHTELRPWRFGGQENLKDLAVAPNAAT